jgi:hypothetical protein
MGDSVWQDIHIGGDPGEHRENLFELIDASFGDFEEDGEHLVMGADMGFRSDIDELKAFLREHGISYNHFSEAKWEYEGMIMFWRPGMDDESWSWMRQDHEETVTVEDLEKMASEGLTLQQVIEKCRVPELPVWVMEADLMLNVATGETTEA